MKLKPKTPPNDPAAEDERRRWMAWLGAIDKEAGSQTFQYVFGPHKPKGEEVEDGDRKL